MARFVSTRKDVHAVPAENALIERLAARRGRKGDAPEDTKV